MLQIKTKACVLSKALSLGDRRRKSKVLAAFCTQQNVSAVLSVPVCRSWTICWRRETRSWTLWSSSPLTTLCWCAGSVAGRSRCDTINYSWPAGGSSLFYFPVVYNLPWWCLLCWQRSSAVCLCIRRAWAGWLIHVSSRVWRWHSVGEKWSVKASD